MLIRHVFALAVFLPLLNAHARGPKRSQEPIAELPQAVESRKAPMTLDRIDHVIATEGTNVKRENGYWEAEIDGVRLAVVTDVNADRMRIITPITDVDRLPEGALHLLLEANYHSALDARYAINAEVVYGAYIHPLSPLDEAELKSALHQVASLYNTFGSTFSSGELIFGMPMAPPVDE